MKRLLLIIAVVLVLTGILYAVEFYKVNITKVETDLYKDSISGCFIKTRWCYEYAYNQTAYIEDNGVYNRNLIFQNGRSYKIEWIKK